MTDIPIIMWFRQDLRLRDNQALASAVRCGRPLLAVYIFDENIAWSPGGASRWWLHKSIESLTADLAEKETKLILKRGDTVKVLQDLVKVSGANTIYCSRQYEPAAIALENAVHDKMASNGVDVKRFAGYLLFEPESIKTQGGTPFKVFTPFWRACCQYDVPKKPLPTPRKIKCAAAQTKVKSERLSDWNLLPKKPNWAEGFDEFWQPGEHGAWRKLRSFLSNGLKDYDHGRDIPAKPNTSGLSPHLHFGEISPRIIWHEIKKKETTANTEDTKSFLSEVGWREFSHHLLFFWPELPEAPFKSRFANFAWADDNKALNAWQRGHTGIPLVDAGMRQLWQSGWMHNRVRMIVASFLVKNLLIPWQQGEKWFWDTLVDANLANNAAGWQWVAGSGADAAPYFRIFNPVSQSKKFDPEGDYIRRWVPELEDLAAKHIHEPWLAPEDVLRDAGITLGKDYPEPITDLKTSRERALALHAELGN